MARQVVVLALIFVAIAGMAVAREAPSESPKSSPSPAPKSSSSPAKAPSASSPKASASSSPESSPAPSSSGEDQDISSPPAPASEASEGPIDFYGAPASGPAADDVASLEDITPATGESNGAAPLRVSALVAAMVAGFFAF